MKKATSILLALVLLLCLSACGGNPSTESPKTSPKVDNTPSESPLDTKTPDVVPSPASDAIVPPLGAIVEPDQRGNTPSNLANNGFVAVSGDWIYYAEAEEYGKSMLKRIRKDGQGEAVMSSTEWTNPYIQVAGDWVYFIDDGLQRIRVDGAEKTKLIDTPYAISDYVLIGDWIYCEVVYGNRNQGEDETNNGMYKVRTDGTELTKLTNGSSIRTFVDGDWIYYRTTQSLYRARTDGSDEAKLDFTQDVGTSDGLIVDDGWVYISRRTGVTRRTVEGNDPVKLIDEKVDTMNVYGDWLYYLNEDSLSKIRLDGTDDTLLYENVNCTDINIVDDWIYCTNGIDYFRLKIDGSGRETLNGEAIN